MGQTVLTGFISIPRNQVEKTGFAGKNIEETKTLEFCVHEPKAWVDKKSRVFLRQISCRRKKKPKWKKIGKQFLGGSKLHKELADDYIGFFSRLGHTDTVK